MVAKQFLRAFISGLLAYLIHLSILVLLSEFLGFIELMANIIGFILGVAINFIGYKKWVLPNNNGSLRKQLTNFYFLNFFALLIHIFLFYFLLKMNIHYIISQSICSILVFVLSFTVSKNIIFKE